MEHAFSEIPLALFSTLAPLGAGAFIMLAAAVLTGKVGAERSQLRKLDVLSIIPLVLTGAGFIAAFFHLSTPLNAVNAFNGLGRSPLSNEIFVGIVFLAAAGLYWIWALTGTMKLVVRKVALAVVALLALVFAAFIGSAYMVSTIPTWDTFWAPVGVLGFCVLGGGLFGLLVLQASGELKGALDSGLKAVALGLTLLGAVLAIGGVVGQFVLAGSLVASIPAAGEQVAAAQPYLIAFVVALALAAFLAIMSLVRKPNTAALGLGCLVILGAVFVGRLVFYGLQINVGL